MTIQTATPTPSRDVGFKSSIVDAAEFSQVGSVDRILADLRDISDAAGHSATARRQLQQRLHWLHYGNHEPSFAFRQWVASTTYGYFEKTALIDSVVQRPMAEFIAELARQQREFSPLHHPLFTRCFSDEATLVDLSVYLRHKWIIMLTFWRSLSDFGGRLQRHDIHNTALVYENVHEELGAGKASGAHLVKHYELLREIGLDISWSDEPEFTETYEYINFRVFCMRHPNTAWGLGSFYSQEATSLEYTLGHYEQLSRLGVGHDKTEIYEAHDEIDAEHTDEIIAIIEDLVHNESDQATVLAAQRHQMKLWSKHFNRVLEQIESGGA